MNVTDIIERLGGQLIVSANVKSKSGMGNVHQTTVATWCRTNRIPQWYWSEIIKLSKGELTVTDLHEASSEKKK